MTERRPFYVLLMLAGIVVPALVALSPLVYVRIEGAGMSLPLPAPLYARSYSLAVLLVGLASAFMLGRRFLARVTLPSPRKLFFVFLMIGFYFSVLPGPYVGTLLLLYYAALLVVALLGADVRLRFAALNWWMLVYLAVCAASLHMLTRGGNMYQIRELLQPFSRFLSVLFIINFLRDWEDFEFVAKVFLAIGFVVIVVAVYQVAMFSLFGKITSLMSEEEGRRRFFTIAGFTFLRATGLFRHPAYLGEVCALGALMPLVQIFRPGQSFRRIVILLFVVAVMLGGMICSFSRASWLAFLVVAVIALPLLKPRWAVRYIVTASILGGLFVLAGGLNASIDYMLEAKTSSVDYRVEIMRLGLDAFSRSPLLGTGLEAFVRYPGNIEKFHVHNTFIMAFTELGVIGGVLILLIYIHAINRSIRNLLMAIDPLDRNLAVILFLALVLILVMQQFEQALHFHMNYFLLGSIEAMSIYLRQKQGENTAARLRRSELIRHLPRTRWA